MDYSACSCDGLHAKIECNWLKYMGLNKERLLTSHSYGVLICVEECCTGWSNDFGVAKYIYIYIKTAKMLA